MKITGTMVNYYVHCKRQCYLQANKINLEDNDEKVKIGKALHEEKLGNKNNSEVELENIKIDKLTKEYLTEVKKSDSDVEAAKWQMYYYLYILKKYGIDRKGKLEFFEKSKKLEPFIGVLTQEIEKELLLILEKIEELVEEEYPPKEKLQVNKCKKCAYYTYCYI
ncbi:MAG: CRISPR-associated protein Cas4 [Peptoniphilaceae bacterium]